MCGCFLWYGEIGRIGVIVVRVRWKGDGSRELRELREPSRKDVMDWVAQSRRQPVQSGKPSLLRNKRVLRPLLIELAIR